jgi:succinoglycan biosynthesis protein ExoM
MTSVVIGICTYNRPDQLHRLLFGIVDVYGQSDAWGSIEVVVVDDGSVRRADAVVAAMSSLMPNDITYHHLGSSDVAAARNAVLEIATPRAPWVAFIDDDCVPDPDWLEALLDMQRRTDADVVTGHVQYTTAPGAPRWLLDEPFCEFDTYEDGAEPSLGTTANALVRSSFIIENGIRFRSSLGQTGGEDMTLFHDVRKAGGRLRYAAKAVVTEELTPARSTLRYHLHRQLWLGNNVAEINRHTGALSNRRLFLRGGRWIVRAWGDALRRASKREPMQLRWTLAVTLRGAGLMLGVFGLRVNHRM